jgi:ubiquinone/menaquinone biosynthesis C-methylase UbiE
LNSGHDHYFKADNAERREWQNPESILAGINLKPGLIFIDVGCGGGFFSLPATKIVGKSGKVYGIDINSDYINELKEIAINENISNIELIIGKAEEIIVCNGCADIVFIGMALHDFEDASRVIGNAYSMLRPGGRLFNLDWKKEEMEKGPSFQKRFSQNYVVELLKKANFIIEMIKPSGCYHYLVGGVKKSNP